MSSLQIISSLVTNRTQRSQIFDLQKRLVDVASEVTTGRKTDIATNNGYQLPTLIELRNNSKRIDSYVSNANMANTRFAAMQRSIEVIRNVAVEIRDAALAAASPGDAISSKALQAEAVERFNQIRQALNAQLDGRFLFAGSSSTTKPIATDGTIFDFSATDSVSTKINDTITVEADILADHEAFQYIFDGFDIITDPNVLLTAADATVAANQITAGLDLLSQVTAKIGAKQRLTKDTVEEHEANKMLINKQIYSIEHSDSYQAATNLAELQNILEASYSTTSRLSRLSLVNYLS